jgi:hypothetical protein
MLVVVAHGKIRGEAVEEDGRFHRGLRLVLELRQEARD